MTSERDVFLYKVINVNWREFEYRSVSLIKSSLMSASPIRHLEKGPPKYFENWKSKETLKHLEARIDLAKCTAASGTPCTRILYRNICIIVSSRHLLETYPTSPKYPLNDVSKPHLSVRLLGTRMRSISDEAVSQRRKGTENELHIQIIEVRECTRDRIRRRG